MAGVSKALGSQLSIIVDFGYTHPSSPAYDSVLTALDADNNTLALVSDDGGLEQSGAPNAVPTYGASVAESIPTQPSWSEYSFTYISDYTNTVQTTIATKKVGDAIAIGMNSVDGADATMVLVQGTVSSISPIAGQSPDGHRTSSVGVAIESVNVYNKA